MDFCTAINCMDGRVQLPVIDFLKDRFNAQYVDVISEPGPNLILAKQHKHQLVTSILDRIEISVHHHHSKGIAIAGHYDCAGNPADESEQISHLREAIRFLNNQYPKIEIIGLWIDKHWRVKEIANSDAK